MVPRREHDYRELKEGVSEELVKQMIGAVIEGDLRTI
jgi:hypothetical protein